MTIAAFMTDRTSQLELAYSVPSRLPLINACACVRRIDPFVSLFASAVIVMLLGS